MGWNTSNRQIFAQRSILAAATTTYSLGRTYCPGAGWLLAWEIDEPDNTELKAEAFVSGAGSLNTVILEAVDMSRHGLVAIPWPVLDLTVKADAATSKIVLHAYAVETAAALAGWPSQLYSTNLQNVGGGATATVTIPRGATSYSVNGAEAHTVQLLDQNANIYDSYVAIKGSVVIGQTTVQPARYTLDGGSVKVTNDGGGAADLVIRFGYDFRVGSSLA